MLLSGTCGADVVDGQQFPVGQDVQLVSPVSEYCPELQADVDDPPEHEYPAGQATQEVEPVEVATSLAEHEVQSETEEPPVDDRYFPAGHGVVPLPLPRQLKAQTNPTQKVFDKTVMVSIQSLKCYIIPIHQILSYQFISLPTIKHYLLSPFKFLESGLSFTMHIFRLYAATV